MKIKSPAAYHHLRESHLLSLPHPNTLRNLLCGQKCDFGFNDVSLDAIRRYFEKSDERDRQGVVIFDEVQLREGVEFSRRNLKFIGFVDFAEFNDVLVEENDKSKLANHALVLMFRPFNDSWVCYYTLLLLFYMILHISTFLN